MRPRRTAQEEIAALARRRLELLSAELADLRHSVGAPAVADPAVSLPEEPSDEAATSGDAATDDPATDDPAPVRVAGPGRHARRPIALSGRLGGWVHDRLPPTLQGRVRLMPGHLTVVALMVAGALAVTAWWVVRADGSTTVVPASSSLPSAAAGAEVPVGPAPLVTPAGEPAVGASGEPAVVVVDVAGRVRRPGIATLPLGSRVVDAVEAAGGVRPGVDLRTLNLARVLVDGEQIVVGVPPPGGVAAPAASAPGAAAPPGQSLVNINTATQAQLEELPGVGPVTATAILEWRTQNGPFTAVDELMEVSGIGEATLAEIAPHVTL